MRQSEIDAQNAYQLRRQCDFRWAADVVVDAWMSFEEVEAVAVIGSVAQALWAGAVDGSSPLPRVSSGTDRSLA